MNEKLKHAVEVGVLRFQCGEERMSRGNHGYK